MITATAKKAKIKKAKQSTRLPLDDVRWRPVTEIVGRFFPHADKDSKMLIARDLTEAVTREKIHCTRRPTKMGHHEPDSELSASLWDDHCFACAPDGDIRVAFRPPPNSGLSFTWIVNRAFYLWEPDCVKAWSAQAPQAVDTRDADASEAEGSEPLRRKPGPRAKAEWQWFVAMKVCTLKHLARPLPTAGELAELCQDELGYHPAETAINKLLRDLHRLLG